LPSPSPTEPPTPGPTITPTEYPTVHPTAVPTHLPTLEPSRFPTEHPTVGPTGVPTAPGTSMPSAVPTGVPTAPPLGRIGVYYNDKYVDLTTEGLNILASTRKRAPGYAVSTFVSLRTDTYPYEIIVVPELEKASPALSAAELTALSTWVSDGGVLVTSGDANGHAARLINKAFSRNYTPSATYRWSGSSRTVPGDLSFCNCNSSIPSVDAVWSLSAKSVGAAEEMYAISAGAFSYEVNASGSANMKPEKAALKRSELTKLASFDRDVAVASFAFGKGRVSYLGFDWFLTDSQPSWNAVLQAAMLGSGVCPATAQPTVMPVAAPPTAPPTAPPRRRSATIGVLGNKTVVSFAPTVKEAVDSVDDRGSETFTDFALVGAGPSGLSNWTSYQAIVIPELTHAGPIGATLEDKGLSDWVSNGGALVICGDKKGRAAQLINTVFGRSYDDVRTCDAPSTATAIGLKRFSAGEVEMPEVSSIFALSASSVPEDEIAYTSDCGAVEAVSGEYARGSQLAAADEDLAEDTCYIGVHLVYSGAAWTQLPAKNTLLAVKEVTATPVRADFSPQHRPHLTSAGVTPTTLSMVLRNGLVAGFGL
jgi:hypothetical protein